MDKPQPTPRENFLMSLLNRVVKEYKALLELSRPNKPFKIVDIIQLSKIPGETTFAIQIANKHCLLELKAGEIISKGYDLHDFNDFHAELIRKAAQGKLIEFLKSEDKEPVYKIVDKKFNKTLQQYVFYVETKEQMKFMRTAEELSKDKNMLLNMDFDDIYDVAYTQGCESILKEKAAILLARSNNEKHLPHSEQ